MNAELINVESIADLFDVADTFEHADTPRGDLRIFWATVDGEPVTVIAGNAGSEGILLPGHIRLEDARIAA